MSISRAQLRAMLLEESIPSYMQLMTSKCYRYEQGVVYTNNQCYHTSLFNQSHVYANLNLHMVYGSLGLGRQPNPFFEFGGYDWISINQFLNAPTVTTDQAGRTTLDAHVWLEDNAGRIYGVVTDQMRIVCQIRNLRPITSDLKVINGIDEAVVRQHGIWHVPAPAAVQQRLAQSFHASWHDTYELYLRHCYQRVYDINS